MCGIKGGFLTRCEVGAPPRQGQQHAERDRDRQHRRAARGDEGQRDALGRQQADVHAHVDQRLQPEHQREPLDGEPRRRIGLLRGLHQRTHDDEGEEADEDEAGDHPVLLGDDGEDEVGVRVGQHRLDRALAGAATQEAAFGEGLDRAVELRVVARRRGEEAVDANAHMVEGRVGEYQAQHAAGADDPGAEQRLAGEIEERPPHHA